MALKNQAITVTYFAWNTSTNAGQTGDVLNHTIKLIQDGTEAAPTNSPAEVDSTNCPGVYKLALTAGDMNFNVVSLCGKSATANVVIIGPQVVTERGVLPAVAPGAANGFFINGSNTGPASLSGGLTVTNSGGSALILTSSGSNGSGLAATGNGLGAGIIATGGSSGNGLSATGNGSGNGIYALGGSTGDGLQANGGATGNGMHLVGGGTSGDGFLAAITNGAPIRGNITGNITGNLSGSVGSVTGAVGSVTSPVTVGAFSPGTITAAAFAAGAIDSTVLAASQTFSTTGSVGSVTGAVGSVTAAVTVSLTETLNAARDLSAVADTSLTLNDAFHCAVASVAGKQTVVSTTYTTETSAGTTLRIFTLDSSTAPTSRT